MTSKELYSLLAQLYREHANVSICSLHKPCSGHPKCGPKGSSTKVINFDEVMTAFQSAMGNPAHPSVDAVCAAPNSFCFIEIKGWQKFLEWTKGLTEAKIKEKAAEYDLALKLSESKSLCCEVLGDKDLFNKLGESFILVTDIVVSDKGAVDSALQGLNNNLLALAVTSNKWYSICNSSMQEQLDQQIAILTYYVQCKGFDDLVIRL